MQNTIVVIDTENFSAKRAENMAILKADSVEHDPISEIYLVGQHAGARQAYVEPLDELFPDVIVHDVPCASYPNAADAVCAFIFGQLVARTDPAETTIYVLSYDKLVLYAGFLAARHGARLVLPSEAVLPPNALAPKRFRCVEFDKLSSPKVIEPSVQKGPLPWWIQDPPDPADNIGLSVLKVQTEALLPKPAFIPFPWSLSVVSVGSKTQSCAIALEFWEDGRKGRTLYSPHVEFRYIPWPDSVWTIRSLRGFRRRYKAVYVGERHISSLDGLVPVADGDSIVMGDFRFLFHRNRFLEISWFEDPKQLVGAIETALRKELNCLMESDVPESVRLELTREGTFSLNHAYFRHFEEILVAQWDHFPEWTSRRFSSKTAFRRTFGSLNRIRNAAMHPSQGPLSDEDQRRLAEHYLILWPALMTQYAA
ncbi:MAG: hypothetical protein WA040_23955, partial [Anaerolineae bacterium]